MSPDESTVKGSTKRAQDSSANFDPKDVYHAMIYSVPRAMQEKPGFGEEASYLSANGDSPKVGDVFEEEFIFRRESHFETLTKSSASTTCSMLLSEAVPPGRHPSPRISIVLA